MSKAKTATIWRDDAPVIDNVVWFSEEEAVKRAGGYFDELAAWMKLHMRKHKLAAVLMVRTKSPDRAHGWTRDAKGRLCKVEVLWPMPAE
jgi:hypothetical protein